MSQPTAGRRDAFLLDAVGSKRGASAQHLVAMTCKIQRGRTSFARHKVSLASPERCLTTGLTSLIEDVRLGQTTSCRQALEPKLEASWALPCSGPGSMCQHDPAVLIWQS